MFCLFFCFFCLCVCEIFLCLLDFFWVLCLLFICFFSVNRRRRLNIFFSLGDCEIILLCFLWFFVCVLWVLFCLLLCLVDDKIDGVYLDILSLINFRSSRRRFIAAWIAFFLFDFYSRCFLFIFEVCLVVLWMVYLLWCIFVFCICIWFCIFVWVCLVVVARTSSSFRFWVRRVVLKILSMIFLVWFLLLCCMFVCVGVCGVLCWCFWCVCCERWGICVWFCCCVCWWFECWFKVVGCVLWCVVCVWMCVWLKMWVWCEWSVWFVWWGWFVLSVVWNVVWCGARGERSAARGVVIKN